MTADDFISAIADDRLLERLACLQAAFPAEYSLTLVIEGLQTFFKQQASRDNAQYRSRVMGGGGGSAAAASAAAATAQRKRGSGRDLSGISRMAVESALETVQLNSMLGLRLLSGHRETAQLVHTYTRAVAASVDRGKQTVFMKVLCTPLTSCHSNQRKKLSCTS